MCTTGSRVTHSLNKQLAKHKKLTVVITIFKIIQVPNDTTFTFPSIFGRSEVQTEIKSEIYKSDEILKFYFHFHHTDLPVPHIKYRNVPV
jgi:hypothetical protein